jgi:hypothetical protein
VSSTDDVAYFWSARTPLAGAWRDQVACFVAATPGVVVNLVEGEQTTITLSAGGDESVQFRFARGRGAGTVPLTSGARLVLVSLGVSARLELELSDRNGEPLDVNDPRALLGRIAFVESAAAIGALAEEVGLLPRRVRLTALLGSAHGGRHGGVFFG